MRSGVTSAAVWPGVSSASRSASAMACASLAPIGELGAADAGQAALGRRERAPFVAEIGGGHGVGDGAAAHRRRGGAAGAAPRLRLRRARRRSGRAGASDDIAGGSRRRCPPRPGRARPIPRRAWRRRARAPGSTTAPSGRRATRASKAATAGAAVVIPAAMVKPVGGRVAQRSAMARSRRLRRVGEVDLAERGELARPAVDDRRGSGRATSASARASSGAIGAASRELRRVDFLDRQRVERPREVGGEAHRFGGAFAGAAQDLRRGAAGGRAGRSPAGSGSARSSGSSAPPMRSSSSGSPIGDQARQDQPAAAGADEGFGERADGAVVGQQDAAARRAPAGRAP